MLDWGINKTQVIKQLVSKFLLSGLTEEGHFHLKENQAEARRDFMKK